jgi:hypothetical protein
MVVRVASLTGRGPRNIMAFPGYSIAGMAPCFERPDLGRDLESQLCRISPLSFGLFSISPFCAA